MVLEAFNRLTPGTDSKQVGEHGKYLMYVQEVKRYGSHIGITRSAYK